MLKSEHRHIKEISESFIADSIKKENPSGLCFATSYPLLIYLETRKIKTVMKVGRVPYSHINPEIPKVSHFWLQIDSDGTILDPTIRQFDNNADSIYIGKSEENEITKKYTRPRYHRAVWFPTAYRIWKTPLDDSTWPHCDFDKRSIPFTIKLASLLHSEIKRMPHISDSINNHFSLYFTPIYIFLNNWHRGEIDFKELNGKLPMQFDDLLKNALLWGDNYYIK